MAGRPVDQLNTPVGEESTTANEKRVGPFARERCEGRINLPARPSVEDLDLQSDGTRSRFHLSQRRIDVLTSTNWIDEYGNTNCCGYQLAQEPQPLCCQLKLDKVDPGRVAARTRETGDEIECDRVFAHAEDDGNYGSCGLGDQRWSPTSRRDDHGHLPADQIRGQRRQPIDLIFGPAIFDRYIYALDVARLPQSLAESPQTVGKSVRRCGVEEPDHRHRRLLRACRKRQCSGRHRAAEQRDELAPVHSITSSARASSVGGISRPSVLAVVRLTMKSNLVGCSTGRSLGFAPRRILST